MKRDLIIVGEALNRLYQVSNRKAFVQEAVNFAGTIFPECVIAWHDTGARPSCFDMHYSNHPGIGLLMHKKWNGLSHESPVVRYYANGGRSLVTHTRELISTAALRASRFFNESWRPFGVLDQVGIGLQVDDRQLGLSIKRDVFFSAREISVLQSWAPHVLRAWRRAYYRGDDPLSPLTVREREVLAWVRQGKRNSEIALILGVSARTVAKHVEHIFEKLSVETRGAAAELARCQDDSRASLDACGSLDFKIGRLG